MVNKVREETAVILAKGQMRSNRETGDTENPDEGEKERQTPEYGVGGETHNIQKEEAGESIRPGETTQPGESGGTGGSSHLGGSIWSGGLSQLEEAGHIDGSSQMEGSSHMGYSITGECEMYTWRTAADVRPKKCANPKYDIPATGSPSKNGRT